VPLDPRVLCVGGVGGVAPTPGDAWALDMDGARFAAEVECRGVSADVRVVVSSGSAKATRLYKASIRNPYVQIT
jgi:hypothetical protein